jgi:hypothetical protein
VTDLHNNIIFQTVDGNPSYDHFRISLTTAMSGTLELTADAGGDGHFVVSVEAYASAYQGSYTEEIDWDDDGSDCGSQDFYASMREPMSGHQLYSFTPDDFVCSIDGDPFDYMEFDLSEADLTTTVLTGANDLFDKDTDTRLHFVFTVYVYCTNGSFEIDPNDPLHINLSVGIHEEE